MPHNSDPIEIRETSPTELSITWADQHVSKFTYVWLRENCPCALCRALHRQGGVEDVLASMVRPDIFPRNIETVGRYALTFAWNDGHDTGIYTFDMLRAACPCTQCVEERAAPG